MNPAATPTGNDRQQARWREVLHVMVRHEEPAHHSTTDRQRAADLGAAIDGELAKLGIGRVECFEAQVGYTRIVIHGRDGADPAAIRSVVAERVRAACLPAGSCVLRACEEPDRPTVSGEVAAGTGPGVPGQPAGVGPQTAQRQTGSIPKRPGVFSLLNILLLALGILALRSACREFAEGRRFARTPPVTGAIVESRHVTGYAKASRSPKAFAWPARPVQVPVVTYEYVVDGKRYTGSSISRNNDDYYLSTFPIFQNPKVYYDPDDPANAYLDSTFDPASAQISACVGVALAAWAGVRVARALAARFRPAG